MADYTLGEVYANQGVYKNPQSSFGAFAQGLQTGELLRQRREAKDQKINEIISKSVQVDPSQFISPIYAKAKEETISFIENAHKLRKQYGDKRFMYTPEFQQAKADYDFKISNWKEESARFKEADKAAASGTGIVDPNYLKAGKSSNYNDWISYKNPLTGEAVDPATGRSNVNIVPTYDLQKNLPQYFSPDDPSLYSVGGKVRKLGGGSNDFVKQWDINPQVLRERAALFAKDHPELVESYLRTRPQEVYAIMQQMTKEAEAQDITLDPQTLARAASIRLLEQEVTPRLRKFREEKVNVPEYKPSTSGGGSTAKQWLYTPTTVHSDTGNINLVPAPNTGGRWDNQVPISKDAPYISVQWTGTEQDNRNLTLPIATDKGEIPVEYQPLAFTKKGNDWIFVGGKTTKVGDRIKKQQEEINMTENKQAAARIANYFGFNSVSDYISHLETEAKKTKGGQTSTSSATKTTTKAQIKSLVGKKGYEGYTEQELIDYYKSQGYTIQ